MTVKLLTEHNLELLSLTGGCTGLSESTLLKLPHCWKSRFAANITVYFIKGTKVSRARVEEAFNSDIQTVLDDVYSWSNDCNQWPAEVKQIISNMMFNLGLTNMNKFERLK